MAVFVLARILDPKNEIGFRILDTKTGASSAVSYASMVDVLKKGKTKVENVKLVDGKVVGTNGSLERYAAVDLNGALLKGKKPRIILAQVGDTGYDIADHNGQSMRVTTAEAMKSAELNGLANGKVVTKDGKSFISAISGTYPAATVAKTGAKPVTAVLPKADYSTLDKCCTLEKLPQGAILRIKEGVPRDALLRFKGFTGNETEFKYEGEFEWYGEHTMRVFNSEGKCLTYSWGSSTTMASQTLWDRNRVILDAIEKLTNRRIYCKK